MLRSSLLLAALVLATCATTHAQKLPAFNVNIHQTTVSGLSSGGFFAVQMHVAYSDVIKGAGVFAGGPFHCAMGSMGTATSTCMTAMPAPNPATYISVTNSDLSKGLIADTKNLANSSVYMFSGTKDTTVKPAVMNALHAYYSNYVHTDIEYVSTFEAAHTQPTDDPHNTNPCWLSSSPYLSNCNYDGAGKALAKLYGTLKPRNDGAAMGKLTKFDQTEFIRGQSMDTAGWVYIPDSCAGGAQCALHIAFHGCQQFYGKIGDAYVAHSGYNKWADTNNLIVLYPQTTSGMISPSNPNGCWDWWGYNGNPQTYDTNKGSQMAAVRDMISRIASGYHPLPAPTGLRITATADHSISMQWDASSTAAGYNIKQDDIKVNPQLLTGTTFTATGLSTGSNYSFTVSAQDSQGAQSGDSDEVIGTTTGPPPPLSPPKDLTILHAYPTSIILSWTAEPGATGYNIYRNGTKVTPAPVAPKTWTDQGLASSTLYAYTATAVGGAGESAQSPIVLGTTASAWNCTTFTASNYDHVAKNRAHQSLGFVFANGSDQGMGLYNIFTMTTLSNTKQDFWIIGQCPPFYKR